MKKQTTKNNNVQIPTINRDGTLVSRLIPVILVGAEEVLDRESKLYLRLLVRLIDKSFSEYTNATEYMEEELKKDDKLAYRFTIIGHLENCINAVSRISKIFNLVIDGKVKRKKYKKEIIIKDYSISHLISDKSKKRIRGYSLSNIRNRIEHIDEDIYFNVFKGELFLDVDENYKQICINKQCVQFSDLILMIKDYHKFILEIFSNLPKGIKKGVYFYDKRKK